MIHTLKKLKEKKGITLLEVVIALACASIALFSFVSLVFSSLKMEDYARGLMDATLIAEKMIKEIREGDFPEIGEEEGPVEGSDGFYFRKHVSDTIVENIRQVNLEIQWDNNKHATEFIFYVRKKNERS